MVAEVELEIPGPANALKVPEEAVLHSGERSVVIVQMERNLFEPREVELGAAGGGFQEIRRGLSAGERVVTSSQFLIDSESNLREAINKIAARARVSTEDRQAEDYEDR
jgi:multidrug efflux pump subunit AcrA (membrane-fusion protein)